MKLINANKLKGVFLQKFSSKVDIYAYVLTEIDKQEPIDAIPCDYIRELIHNPNNIGTKSYVLSWLLKRWKNESEGNN